MISRAPVLYVRHSALDSVDPNDVDGLREIWSSFSGAKNSINQGARLEYLSWRLYSRGVLSRQREKEAEGEEVPSLREPPALEMSSSSESIHRGRLSQQRLMDLFDRIYTNPATPEGIVKSSASPINSNMHSPSIHSSASPVPAPASVEMTPPLGTTPQLDVKPPSPREGIEIQQREPVPVCGFDRVSVNNRSTLSLHGAASAHDETEAAARLSNLKLMSPRNPEGKHGMFFIESSSDSDPDHDHDHHDHDYADDNIRVPTPVRPGIIRRKTVTFEEPSTVESNIAGDDNDDDYDDVEDDDDEENSDNWGDSDWADLSDDDEPLFSGRDVPLQPQERRSLLSSMFTGSVPQLSTPEFERKIVPSPDTMPRAIASDADDQVSLLGPQAKSEVAPIAGGAPYLGRVESQSSLFESAMRNRTSHNNMERMLLRGAHHSAHIPIKNSLSLSSSAQSDEIMERELSQSIRTNLSQRRRYDLDVLWQPHSNRPSSSQRRPTLSRSTTMPIPNSNSIDEENDIHDSQSYHARGW